MKVFCSVYRSSRNEDTYLYLARGGDMESLPEALRKRFGRPVHVMDLVLTPERRLARADAGEVIERISAAGYYLQMPPRPEAGCVPKG